MRSRRATPWPAMAAESLSRCVPYGGRTWRQANLEPASGRWAWRLWSVTVEAEPEELSVTARAWDKTGATQPGATLESAGYPDNAWANVALAVA
jgi:sulfite oxidase